MRYPLAVLRYVWAGTPLTLIGLTAGTLGLLTGGRGRRVGPTVEFWGGFVGWALRRLVPLPGGANAMTCGHVILGCTDEILDRCREHEWVHVRQCERWGPLFLPAYFLSSAWVWWRGGRPYRDNPFEVEAYDFCARRTGPLP